jgi:hypothetical protein
VRADRRRQGLATLLMERCLRDIEEQGLAPMLDATEDGRLVYQRLGFSVSTTITRYDADSPRWHPPAGNPVIHPTVEDLAGVLSLDAEASGFDRSVLLKSYLSRFPSGSFLCRDVTGAICGFSVSRTGLKAVQIGPVVARNASIARSLIFRAASNRTGRVLLDVPDAQVELQTWLETSGFRIQRRFVRMGTGRFSKTSTLFAIGGPELG